MAMEAGRANTNAAIFSDSQATIKASHGSEDYAVGSGVPGADVTA